MVNKIKVFVYGTLKKDHPLHRLLERGKDVEYVGRNYIDEPLMLVDMGAFPALVHDDYDINTTYRVFGEVYMVDPETLASLDYAEGYPKLYKREKLEMRDCPKPFKAWTYILSDDASVYAEDWIESGVWNPTDAEKAYVNKISG